ncbi:alkaline phosphatase D family protein [Novosphingobium sp. PS1R-30]|uniref:Alkaline phosphatase D family protein n=1 Tax=Novosphingobium anseongense TaxID=3133436 RepID=A0ABU8RTG8_9SPHN
MRRRELLKNGVLLSSGLMLPAAAPAIVASDGRRPIAPLGVMSGDVAGDRAMIWSSADRPARMVVEWSDDASFRQAHRLAGPLTSPDSGLTAKLDLTGLPADRQIFYRVAFHDPDDSRAIGEWTTGRFRTPSTIARRPVRFTFAGDEAGQGFGINPDIGGYRIYEAMRRQAPDFFIHQGDQIYADGPLKPETVLPGGRVWRNLMTEAKSHIAETLDDFRGAYAYNLLDENKRRFLAQVPMHVQWDDHEVRNNWFPQKRLTQGPDMPELVGHARRALHEFNPIRLSPNAPGLYRSFRHGLLIEVFLLDARSHRSANQAGGGARLFGPSQVAWLKAGLRRSTATWKLIATDIPLSLTVPDLNKDMPAGSIEGLADGKPDAPGSREAELAEILSFLRSQKIRNTVWISADVHYAAAIEYEPGRARFGDFDPFWEFVAGPINAGTGTLAGNPVDTTFGAEVVFKAVPETLTDASPLSGFQFFGQGEVDPVTRALTMSIHDMTGSELYRRELPAT